jgi:transposase-like protein
MVRPAGKIAFDPERCPWRSCARHADPTPLFFVRYGSYRSRVSPFRIPRFRCRTCRRTFSSQTFQLEYRLRKTWFDDLLLRDFVSGVSLRQSARTLGLSLKTVEARFVCIGTHCLDARENVLADWKPKGNFQFDEIETFEHHRTLKPLTVGLLVAGGSGFLVDTAVGQMRSRASGSEKSRKRREIFELRAGRRPNESRAVVRACLGRLEEGGPWGLVTDKKPLYGPVVADLLRKDSSRVHWTVSGRGSKGPSSPLFGVNHMAAKVRYGMARLIRRTWSASKKRERLRMHLAIYWMWHNAWRWRTNKVNVTPGMEEGLWTRRLSLRELLGWRQDWGKLSRRLDAA